MLLIKHRVNSIADLRNTSTDYGVELDLRNEGKNIIINHEPYDSGELFEAYLNHYNHRFIILNIKTEGIEAEVLRILKKYNVENYFFLDLSLPFLVKYLKLGESNIAIRFSEFEPLEFVLKFKNKARWIWVDCFTDLPLNLSNYRELEKHFKICLVSPELQGYSTDRIQEFKKKIIDMNIDAVCTKRPDLW